MLVPKRVFEVLVLDISAESSELAEFIICQCFVSLSQNDSPNEKNV